MAKMIKIPKSFGVINYIADHPDICINDISKKIEVSYKHAHDMVKELKKHGFIETYKKGRRNSLYLTPKGDKFSYYVSEIMIMLGEYKNYSGCWKKYNIF